MAAVLCTLLVLACKGVTLSSMSVWPPMPQAVKAAVHVALEAGGFLRLDIQHLGAPDYELWPADTSGLTRFQRLQRFSPLRSEIKLLASDGRGVFPVFTQLESGPNFDVPHYESWLLPGRREICVEPLAPGNYILVASTPGFPHSKPPSPSFPAKQQDSQSNSDQTRLLCLLIKGAMVTSLFHLAPCFNSTCNTES